MVCPDINGTNPELPKEIPVMVLPECHLFPGCLLPLYIFEQRYRQMLSHALQTNRIFCIGSREGEDEDAPISNISTAGLVRACVQKNDGTSHLLLLGMKRIRFLDWTQEKPFRVARIEPVVTELGNPTFIRSLKARVLEMFAKHGDQAQQLRDTLAENEDLELVCDVLSYHFTRCPKLQQKLLTETRLERRYSLLIEALEKHPPGT